ncbi:MAG TPA: hypothetical protein VH092_12605, partial [Urbifossiella sp.]|nr:hypothetical protein [Urbifossiella sp.]
MTIRIVRSLMLHLVVAPEKELRQRVPVFAGQKFVVVDHQEDDGFDWMRPEGGGLLPLPPDAWEVA